MHRPLQSGGASIASSARALNSPGQVVKAVSQIPNAFGYGNPASMKVAAVKAVEGLSVDQPLSLVTKGEPDDTQKRLIAAVKSAGN